MKKPLLNLKKQNTKSDYYDYNLVAVIVLLVCFGLVMLYSTSSYMAEVNYGNDMFYFKKQALISAACLIVALFISKILDYHVLLPFTTALYVASLILMGLVRTPLGHSSHGATRWLYIGPINFQPAEIAKIAVIIMMAYMIGKMGRKVKTLKSCMILGLPGAGLALAAYVLTDNLSTAMIILGITVGMVFVAHPDTRPFIIIGIVGIVLIVIGVLFLVATTKDSNSFRVMRVLVWLQPEKYSDEGGYQTLQALYAIGSGGFFGRGLGNSIQKLGSVPEAQNDMIFSIICEELGLPKFQRDEQQKTQGMSNAEYYPAVTGESWKFELMRVIDECMRYAGNFYTYCAAGNPEHCRCTESDAEYRCYIALYQLRRNIDRIPDVGDGNCPQCGPSDKISRVK